MSKPVVVTLAFVAIVGIHLTLAENKVELAFKTNCNGTSVQVAPKKFLKVIYENNVKAYKGHVLTYNQVTRQQHTVEWDADKEKFFTLIMLGPDLPTRHNLFFREYLHWLVVNISGANVTSKNVLAVYKNIQMPVSSGLHRNVFLLYQQKGKSTFNMKPIIHHTHHQKPQFNVNKFAKENPLGSQIAGNFFNCKWID